MDCRWTVQCRTKTSIIESVMAMVGVVRAYSDEMVFSQIE
jgi:hypothetical protein